MLDISDISSGNISKLGAVELGTDANAVYVAQDYAYLATDSNSEEVMVIRLSDYTKVN